MASGQTFIPFAKTNLVVIDENCLDFRSVLNVSSSQTLETTFDTWEYGNLISFSSPTNPSLTHTQMPFPYGRMSNYALQKAILKTADVFLVILHTTTHSYHQWPETISKEYPGRPVICWINRGTEERVIEQWKKTEKQRLLRLAKSQDTMASMKEKGNPLPDALRTYGYEINSGFWGGPVTEPNVYREQVSQVFPSTEISEVDLSPLMYADPNAPSPITEEQTKAMNEKIAKDLERVYELAVKLHEEKGLIEEVQESKQKSLQELMEIKPRVVEKKKKKRWFGAFGRKLSLFS
eukprot:TRINITY_DN3851_c0_g1_i2.p1 TRINITY_DN3851_c0_g1~~TRINITY_DN3851_c0_g1_i2.p1  ORF type:complete len:293 (-),score=70.95 TRINITY_DN3851_c0_g1_i2:131-1009(-)